MKYKKRISGIQCLYNGEGAFNDGSSSYSGYGDGYAPGGGGRCGYSKGYSEFWCAGEGIVSSGTGEGDGFGGIDILCEKKNIPPFMSPLIFLRLTGHPERVNHE